MLDFYSHRCILNRNAPPDGEALNRNLVTSLRLDKSISRLSSQTPQKASFSSDSAHGYTNGKRICVETEKRRFRLALMDKTVMRHFMGVSRYSGRYKATDNILSVLMNCLQGGRSKDYGVPIVYMIDM